MAGQTAAWPEHGRSDLLLCPGKRRAWLGARTSRLPLSDLLDLYRVACRAFARLRRGIGRLRDDGGIGAAERSRGKEQLSFEGRLICKRWLMLQQKMVNICCTC